MGRKAATFAVLSGLIGLLATPAHSQTIQIGGDELILGAVASAGYDSARITERQLTIVRTEACKGERKFRVKVSILGQITSEQEMGPCDLRPARAERRQERRDERRQERREERRENAVQDAVDTMRRNGFVNIEASLEGRQIVANGCRNGRRTQFVLAMNGDVLQQDDIGRCRQEIAGGDVTKLLSGAGYDRVRLVQGNAAPFIAEGCEGDRLYQVRIDRYGTLVSRERIGRCAVRQSIEQVEAALRAQGLDVLSIAKAGDGYTADTCRGERLARLSISAAGQTLSTTDAGSCRSQTVREVLSTLEQRGARNLTPIVEGCFEADRFRWIFDRFGNRTGRERIGSC